MEHPGKLAWIGVGWDGQRMKWDSTLWSGRIGRGRFDVRWDGNKGWNRNSMLRSGWCGRGRFDVGWNGQRAKWERVTRDVAEFWERWGKGRIRTTSRLSSCFCCCRCYFNFTPTTPSHSPIHRETMNTRTDKQTNQSRKEQNKNKQTNKQTNNNKKRERDPSRLR